ncbi:MAG: hypothetical protein M1608_13790 [Candidatus Omnitrophica bacterium]|nr:hypothetical protein [Candidatus Omnitrophota bacterium]
MSFEAWDIQMGRMIIKKKSIELTGNANNLDIGGASFIRFYGTAGDVDITGFANGMDGYIVQFFNDTNGTITIKFDDAASDAGNRFYNTAGLSLSPNIYDVYTFIYDADTAHWLYVP